MGHAAGPRPDAKLSEAEFLKKQAEDAKAAVAHTFAEIKAKLGEGANPVEWAREYPWTSLGLAAAAGFFGTTMIVPSREQQALAKLAAIEKALNPAKSPTQNHDADEKSGANNSLLTVVVREVLAIVRPLLLSLLTAGLASRDSTASALDPQPAAPDEPVKEPVAT